ncbi:hypothetical protein EV356DRAFT_505127 [Viridothelium virens]|uniref:Uncharacterized protein n=1 Tax=Viridothelium virens TaxID=1048519 RepID=A0A6A6H3W6_VIRVR|nr:hypothetical protein EV356DRAFT_505127 [Viridothelium virens]
MTFFNYAPGSEGEPEAFMVSQRFWLYWAVSVPLTGATMGLWYLWMRLYPVKAIGSS